MKLKPVLTHDLHALDLYAGCGGLALGFESAGIHTTGIEIDQSACNTYNANLLGVCRCEKLSLQTIFQTHYDMVIGGPPCQPFSKRGKNKGWADDRDGFPTYINAIDAIRPQVLLIENVKGLIAQHKSYFDLQIEALKDLGYDVHWKILNAMHYSVPQKRERLFIIGFKNPTSYKFPEPNTSIVTVQEAIGDIIHLSHDDTSMLTPTMDEYIAKYEAASKCKRPRDLHLDKPSRTLTCRNLSGKTSDMMRVCLPNGSRRTLSVHEAKRLQSFPDWFDFKGTVPQQMKQIGNSVPPLLAHHMARSVLKHV